MIFVAAAICVVGISLSLAWAFTSYTKEAHKLSEQRDARAHELAKKETDAIGQRMKIESSRATENDISIARLNYHTAQTVLAEKMTMRLNYLSEDKQNSTLEALIRQLDGIAPPQMNKSIYYSDEGKALT